MCSIISKSPSYWAEEQKPKNKKNKVTIMDINAHVLKLNAIESIVNAIIQEIIVSIVIAKIATISLQLMHIQISIHQVNYLKIKKVK